MDHPEPSQPGAPVTDGETSKPCVLLVEDDRSLRRYFEVTLQRAGYEVIAAGDGLAAFLRGTDRLSKIPIVLLTGQENKSAAGAVNAPIDAFLYKPVKADELTNCLSKLLQQSSH